MWDLIFIGVALAITIEFMGLNSLVVAVGVYLPVHVSVPIMVGGIVRWLVDFFTKDAKRFLRSQVQVADTWQSIAARFYGRGDEAARLQALNADAPLQPGTRVVVPLPE